MAIFDKAFLAAILSVVSVSRIAGANLGVNCSTANDCSPVNDVDCINKTCQCQPTHYNLNMTSCLPKKGINETCNSASWCKNTLICNNKCVCISSQYWKTDRCADRIDVNGTCSDDLICIQNAFCNASKKCNCNFGYTSSTSGKECKGSGVEKMKFDLYMYILTVVMSIAFKYE